MNFPLLLILTFLLLPIFFQVIYLKELNTLKGETKRVKPIKFAKNFLIILFKKNKKLWLIKGALVDLSKPQKVFIENCFAKNFLKNIEIKAQKAIYYPLSQKIKLMEQVELKKLDNPGKPTETVLTKFAFIDLKNDRIYGPTEVTIKNGNITLVGMGFIYDGKSGRFKIIKDVQTIISTP